MNEKETLLLNLHYLEMKWIWFASRCSMHSDSVFSFSNTNQMTHLVCVVLMNAKLKKKYKLIFNDIFVFQVVFLIELIVKYSLKYRKKI